MNYFQFYEKRLKTIIIESCNIRLDDVNFTECKAVYGGAIYIYSNLETNEFCINKCRFMNNQAYSLYETKGLYGGGAIYLNTKRSKITNCTFYNNKGQGGAIKIDLVFRDETIKAQKLNHEQNHESILISACEFEKSLETTSDIFFIHKENEIQININECSFKGKLLNGSYYIDGYSFNNDKSHLLIHSCNFQYDMKYSINIKLNENKESLKNYISITNLIYLVISTIAFSVLILIIKKHRNVDKNEENLSTKVLCYSLNSENDLQDIENPSIE